MTYKKELTRLYHSYSKNDAGFKVLVKRLQESYPGNYTVEEYFNSDIMSWDARLKFLSEEDEMWFKLKYD